jgi:two-component system, OmpR family, sensor kinase
MRSLLIRIFLSFWLVIGITIGVAALAGYYYAERMRDTAENFADSDTLLEASDVLSQEGREGLRRWLEDRPAGGGITLLVVDANRRDLLGRRLPRRVRHLFHQQDAQAHGRVDGRHDSPPQNVRPARPLPQLVAPNGEVFTFLALPSRQSYRRWLDEQAIPLFLVIALLLSAGASYLLARTVSGPVQRLRAATLAIAEGDLSTRVADNLDKRRDELGLLARDFDRMAEKLEQAAAQQTELSSNISHELRSPLARLRVALELARQQAGELPEFARIDQETERLNELIGQILSYARLDAADVERSAPLGLRELLEEVVDNVNYECRADSDKQVRVELQCAAAPVVAVYRGALTSALENVLRNAVAHSPANGVVNVVLEKRDDGVRIAVTDNGPGVPADELDKLFEPFYRTRAAKATEGGSGLGLAIAARAVELHAGRITASNTADGGLQVLISLPSGTAG